MENTKEKIDIANAVVTESALTNCTMGSTNGEVPVMERMKSVSAEEYVRDKILKITAVSLKVTADIRKDLSIPKYVSTGSLLRFFKSMRAKKNDVQTKFAYERTIALLSAGLENDAKLTKYHYTDGVLTMWFKFSDFRKARKFVEFISNNS